MRDFVLERADTAAFLERFEDLLPGDPADYEAEGKSYLTVAIGCTGAATARSRSPRSCPRLRARGTAVRTTHRDSAR